MPLKSDQNGFEIGMCTWDLASGINSVKIRPKWD